MSISRRELLRLSAAGLGGASLSGWLGRLAAGAAAQGPARKRCIVLWMDGGPSHIDTFDPKPDARAEVRGELASIPTAVPGVRVSEKFPTLAGMMGDLALGRECTRSRTTGGPGSTCTPATGRASAGSSTRCSARSSRPSSATRTRPCPISSSRAGR